MHYEFNKSIEMALADFDNDFPLRCQIWSFGWHHGRVLALGKNSNKTNPLNIKNPLYFSDGKIHSTKNSCAELIVAKKLIAMTRVPFKKITLVNVRLDKQLNIKNSRPCSSCANLLKFVSFRGIWHTNDLGKFEQYQIDT